jgi:hypothetical protein
MLAINRNASIGDLAGDWFEGFLAALMVRRRQGIPQMNLVICHEDRLPKLITP